MTKPAKQPGALIAFEGLDGSGKTTQTRLVLQWLASLGCRAILSEWSSSELVMGATIRAKNKQLLTPTTFCLIHATDFADRYERQILPMLKGGYIVLCDRYVFTAFARDGVRGCDPAWLRKLYGFARLPDITLHFDLPLHVALGRVVDDRKPLKYFEAGMDLGFSADTLENYRLYQGRVQDQYRRIASEFGFVTMDAARPIHDQQTAIREELASRIRLDDFRAKGVE